MADSAYPHLEKIESPADLRSLSVPELKIVAAELREFLIDTIAKVQECVVPRPSALIPNYPIDLEKVSKNIEKAKDVLGI